MLEVHDSYRVIHLSFHSPPPQPYSRNLQKWTENESVNRGLPSHLKAWGFGTHFRKLGAQVVKVTASVSTDIPVVEMGGQDVLELEK